MLQEQGSFKKKYKNGLLCDLSALGGEKLVNHNLGLQQIRARR
jgi:hypothetical protein